MHHHHLQIWPLRSTLRPHRSRPCRRSLQYISRYVNTTRKLFDINEMRSQYNYPNKRKTCYQAYHGHDEILQLLLPLFPNTNIKEDSGKTPLDLASYKGHKHCIVLLLRFGASVAVQVRRIWTLGKHNVYTRSINVTPFSRTPSRSARPCIVLPRQVTRIAWLSFCRIWTILTW